MYRVGIIGDRESVLCFRAVGFRVEEATDQSTALVAFKKLVNKDYGVIFVTEQISLLISEQIDKYKDMPLPAVIILPNNQGSTGIGMENIMNSVKRAVGADIFGESGD